eukprot:CAMPEP_0172599920 /NCGR_PEP_ID=MMETSP1068-20121228/20047_1 /TAXON_ID=35684 /ORGANISM="Pseudopedinella elastica, Strain CCMP716" /LENGTH=60 /DNA_ID=CAMNT_0013400341 /DNA_START=533 /DNA_END=715 /DNA_ORIENTATION=-
MNLMKRLVSPLSSPSLRINGRKTVKPYTLSGRKKGISEDKRLCELQAHLQRKNKWPAGTN